MTTLDTDSQAQLNEKRCSICGSMKPLGEFLRRTGRRPGRHGRRGTCRACRSGRAAALPETAAVSRAGTDSYAISGDHREVDHPVAAPPAASHSDGVAMPPARKKRPRKRRRAGAAQKRQAVAAAQPEPAPPKREKQSPTDVSFLRPTAQGFIRMRGKTDNGRRWYQEIEPELAQILVREGAAVVVNRHTIRRLYSNKEFRKLILTRDNYTCRFCGRYGDTIDHELPRAKGGHTTPANCVCACYECNQLKANRDVDEFIRTLD
ncbi:HNH endonuclease [Paenibacillus sp. NPDC057967]|uniref:HNH endonuclease n=1 Tax=Paenibacillus sp. NPDC057967 TaxID=3346293 RepID=UPI0036DA1035